MRGMGRHFLSTSEATAMSADGQFEPMLGGAR